MYCTKCGVELRNEDRFCSSCGRRTGIGRTETVSKPLMLDKRNKKIAGVCAGFARYFEIDPTLVRVIWLVAAICSGGLGVVAYVIAWILMPSDHGIEPGTETSTQLQTSL